jgi:hypothetical protein
MYPAPSPGTAAKASLNKARGILDEPKDFKCVCRLSSKIKDEGFEVDLYTKH